MQRTVMQTFFNYITVFLPLQEFPLRQHTTLCVHPIYYFIISFRRSLDNSPEFCKFFIKFGSLSIDELYRTGSYRDKIRFEDLKAMIMHNGYSACDSCHVLDLFVIEIQSVNDYYQSTILPELNKIVNQFSLRL